MGSSQTSKSRVDLEVDITVVVNAKDLHNPLLPYTPKSLYTRSPVYSNYLQAPLTHIPADYCC